ncbi:hydroxyisourate hydrolase [Acetobacter sp. AN02]|uniref:hydroxyisourate hydrolase n=1 Tax=Acetobacter sp. AN02 TaxID=2894186 RepID=UPI0024341B63|nr:hydroxyisourate hydrolase [Acetobacter sp. AN02]MDG6094773.1 hydroxyisourate hydrolase [Acetobacter sp. AN02]
MSTLSTHVLNLVSGCPAAGMSVTLRQEGKLLFSGETNPDGRCPELKNTGALEPGSYCLEFAVADYFRQQGTELSDPPFLDKVPLVFGISGSGGHYHVPLLVSPFGFSTYRGS